MDTTTEPSSGSPADQFSDNELQQAASAVRGVRRAALQAKGAAFEAETAEDMGEDEFLAVRDLCGTKRQLPDGLDHQTAQRFMQTIQKASGEVK